MTPQDELTLLEAAYTSLLTGGAKSISAMGRSFTFLDMDWLTKRMDLLRAQVIRQTTGMAFASQFRKPE